MSITTSRRTICCRATATIVPLVLAAIAPAVATAALGDDQNSVESDRVQLRAALRTAPSAAYTVQELQLASGTIVREYLSPAGRVFAVTWQGPAMPDLRQLLGSSFETWRAAPRAPGSGRSHSTVESPQLVVHSAGHPRYYAGAAYLPQWLPSGVSAGDLR